MKPGPGPSEIILQQIGKLSEKIDALNQRMQNGFLQNAKMQQAILKTVVQGIGLIQQQLTQGFRGLTIQMSVQFENIIHRIQFLTRYIAQGVELQFLDSLKTAKANANFFLDGAYGHDIVKNITAINEELLQWGEQKSCDFRVNGVIAFIADPKPEQMMELLQQALHRPNYYLGLIANYIQKQYGATLNSVKIEKISNPEIWLDAVKYYIALNEEFLPCDIDNDDIRIKKVMQIGEYGQTFIKSLREDPDLWNNLFGYYATCLKEVLKCANEVAKQYSQQKLREFNKICHNKVQQLDFLQPIEGFIQQFENRAIAQCHGDIATASYELAEVTQLEQYKLILAKFIEKSTSHVDKTLLAAEFLQLLTFSVAQVNHMQGLDREKRYGSALICAREIVNDEAAMLLPFNLAQTHLHPTTPNQMLFLTYPQGMKFGRGEPPFSSACMGPGNLKTSTWTLPLELRIAFKETQAQQAIDFSFTGEWKTFMGGHGISVWTEESPHDNQIISRWDGRLYFPVGYGDGLDQQLREFIRDYWNHGSEPLTVTAKMHESSCAAASSAISDFYLQQRQTIVDLLMNCQQAQEKDVANFNNTLIALDNCVLLIRQLGCLAGKSIDTEFFKDLVTRADVMDDLNKYQQDKQFKHPWLSCLAPKESLNYQKIKKFIDTKKSEQEILWNQGVTQIQLYIQWKKLYKVSFPTFSRYVDLSQYKAELEEARNHYWFQVRALAEFMQMRKRKYEEAIHFFENPDTNPWTTDNYQDRVHSIYLWSTVQAQEELCIKFLPSTNLEDLDNNSMTALTDLYVVKYGWTFNIASLINYANAIDQECRLHTDDLVNMTMFLEGVITYLRYVVNNLDMHHWAVASGYTNEMLHKTGALFYSIGLKLKNTIQTIALSRVLFSYLFDRYLDILQEPYKFILEQKNKKRVDIETGELVGKNSVQLFRLLHTGVYQGACILLFDQLATYAVWMRLYLEMAYGYDVKLVKKNTDQVFFQGSSYTLYASRKSWSKYFDEEKDNLDKVLEDYIKNIVELKERVIHRIDEADDLNRLCGYLSACSAKKVIELVLDKNILKLPLHGHHIKLLELYCKNHHLVKIEINNIVVSQESLRELLKILLACSPELCSLRISNSSLSVNALQSLQENLQHFKQLTCLDLSGNDLSEQDKSRIIMHLLDNLSSLMFLNLSACKLNATDIDRIRAGLYLNDKVEKPFLAHNPGCDDSVVDFPRITPFPLDMSVSQRLNYHLGQPMLDHTLSLLNLRQRWSLSTEVSVEEHQSSSISSLNNSTRL